MLSTLWISCKTQIRLLLDLGHRGYLVIFLLTSYLFQHVI